MNDESNGGRHGAEPKKSERRMNQMLCFKNYVQPIVCRIKFGVKCTHIGLVMYFLFSFGLLSLPAILTSGIRSCFYSSIIYVNRFFHIFWKCKHKHIPNCNANGFFLAITHAMCTDYIHRST